MSRPLFQVLEEKRLKSYGENQLQIVQHLDSVLVIINTPSTLELSAALMGLRIIQILFGLTNGPLGFSTISLDIV